MTSRRLAALILATTAPVTAAFGAAALNRSTTATQATQTFTGIISDAICAKSHAGMQMGPTDGECAVACHQEHGEPYVLVGTERVYKLSDQETPEQFAGRKVRVRGILDTDTGTIRVDSISPE